ncbi:hypothetical protein ISF_09512 [Cordyceps fumosorosea ARSEF 2679]|uniref:Uncharacterized protein n=1 Tax=Cordyceps fumosorosea (strain ARSEF 2679) TaxID=1081104 RepID=A0A162M071_CORFA|nr:hypothetical protein ISF_09512 [Cordyceps fumosorosea ARSEF 2679]OAA47980.1 hypothetical protein ISF_09512 [Cordyceps fumosorosea ARSEF 2679]
MRLSVLTTTTALATAAAAQQCDYGKGHSCINPDASSASVLLPIPTLFPNTPPSFVFAIDDLEHSDIIAITAANKDVTVPSASANGPIQAVSWWLQFNNGTANATRAQERAYTAWALESNSTSDISGADGGCEGLLGSDCVQDLKTLFTDKNTLTTGSSVVGGALMKFFATPPKNLRCPSIFWGDGSGRDLTLYGTSDTRPLIPNSEYIARMSEKYLLGKTPVPGNASYTHGRTTMRFRSLDAQKKLAIVAFSLGYPAGGPGDRADNTLSMACLRIGQADKSSGGGGGGGGGGGKDSAAGRRGVGVATLAVTLAMMLLAF